MEKKQFDWKAGLGAAFILLGIYCLTSGEAEKAILGIILASIGIGFIASRLR